jgi:hypothetical protein
VAGEAFRGRERLILFSGAVAAAFVALCLVATIAGSSLGSGGARVASTLVLIYLCARLWGHAKTLEERGSFNSLSRIGRVGAPFILLVLLAQTWVTSGIDVNLSLALPVPVVHITTWTRVEWTADVAVTGLFLLTAMAVWLEGSTGWSSLVSRASFVVVGFLTVDLLGAVWGLFSLGPQVRLVIALVVLSFAGPILVATLRRVERLDELPGPTPES